MPFAKVDHWWIHNSMTTTTTTNSEMKEKRKTTRTTIGGVADQTQLREPQWSWRSRRRSLVNENDTLTCRAEHHRYHVKCCVQQCSVPQNMGFQSCFVSVSWAAGPLDASLSFVWMSGEFWKYSMMSSSLIYASLDVFNPQADETTTTWAIDRSCFNICRSQPIFPWKTLDFDVKHATVNSFSIIASAPLLTW